MIEARQILKRREWLCAGLALAWLSGACAQADSRPDVAKSPIEFRWAVRSPSVEALRGDLIQRKVTLEQGTEPFKPPPDQLQEYTDSSFAPLVVIAGAVALSVVLEAVLKFYRGAKGPGGLIDVRGERIEIREVPSLPSGSILVITRDKPPLLLEATSGADVAALVRAVAPAAAGK